MAIHISTVFDCTSSELLQHVKYAAQFILAQKRECNFNVFTVCVSDVMVIKHFFSKYLHSSPELCYEMVENCMLKIQR